MRRVNSRGFLRELAYVSAALVLGGPGIYASAVEPFAVEIVQQRIPLPGLNPGLSGLRAAQISDLHMGMWISRAQLERVVSLVLEQKPDLVFITGDCLTIGGNLDRALADLEAALSPLARQLPVYAVLGNHDRDAGGKLQLRALYKKISIFEMRNLIQPYRSGANVLYIAGIESVTGGHPRLYNILQEAPSDGPMILMVHEPDIANYTASSGKFALQISGHSHGGQVNFPLLGRLVLPWLGRKYPAGLYSVK